jgi:hypothetical protein
MARLQAGGVIERGELMNSDSLPQRAVLARIVEWTVP